jgi:hypothetical protein
VLRPLLCLAVLACVVGTAACRSDANPPGHAAGSPSPVASSGSPVAGGSPASSCPSAAEFIKAMDAKDWTGYRVTGPIVCDGGWATTTVEITTVASDPAHAVLRQVGGRWRGITYGTDGLCTAPGMHPAPAAIRKALGDYC